MIQENDLDITNENILNEVGILATNTISGKWQYEGSTTGVNYPMKKAKVVVEYQDQYFIWNNIGTTYTDDNGNWSLTYTEPSYRQKIRVWAYSENPTFGKIQDNSNTTYSAILQLGTEYYGGPIGTWVLTGFNKEAFWLFNNLEKTYSKLASLKNPGTATIVWYLGSTEWPHYTHGGKIYLNQDSPRSDFTIIHELGHNYMYNLYGNWYPPTSCPSPHYVNQSSEAGCAWTEGWASFLALYVNNSPIYKWADGSTENYENKNSSTSGWDSGDTVEGRVVGALWDLYDSVNDGLDTRSYTFSAIYYVMYSQKSKNFSEY